MPFTPRIPRRIALIRDFASAAALLIACTDNQTITDLNDPEYARRSVAAVEVFPGAVNRVVGQTAQFGADVRNSRGTVLDRVATWSSSDSTVTRIDAAGLATAVGVGTATITASAGGKNGTALISVSPAPVAAVASVTVTPGSNSLLLAGVQQLTATLKDSAGNFLTDRAITWSSSDSTVARIDSAGLAIAVGVGTATITAAAGGKGGTALVTVSAPPVAAVASVTVTPASSSLPLGGIQQLTATPKDSAGNPLTDRAVTWSSSNASVAGVSGAGLVTGLLAGTATITASSEGSSGTAQTSVIDGGSTKGNEPAGFRLLNDQAWNSLTGNGWNYLRRTSSIDASIVTDLTAPVSPSSVLRIAYSAGCCTDAEPSVHWMSVPGVQEIYTSWSMKLSPNWIPNPAGGGKITFLWTNGVGQVYTNLYHQAGTAETGWTQGPPYRIGLNTEWSPYGQKIWLPNVATTGINPGEWHKIEVYYRWGTSGNGVIRWWVDGVLNGDYSNVSFPTSGTNFSQFEFAPTVQYAGSEDRYMYVDHTYVSIP